MSIKQSYCIGQKSGISLIVFSPCSAKTNIGWGRKLNGHLVASCVRYIRTKNYQSLLIAL